MFISFIVWSYSKDILHHAAALKIHLVVGKFQGIFFWGGTLVKNEGKQMVSSVLCITINRFYGCYCDSSKHDI